MLTIKYILENKSGLQAIDDEMPSSKRIIKDLNFVYRLIQIIEESYQNPSLNRAQIASKLAVSDRQLQRKLKAIIGQNPMELLRTYRLKVAKEKLRENHRISDIGMQCGFSSLSYFSQCFKAKFGVSPKKYQQSIQSIQETSTKHT